MAMLFFWILVIIAIKYQQSYAHNTTINIHEGRHSPTETIPELITPDPDFAEILNAINVCSDKYCLNYARPYLKLIANKFILEHRSFSSLIKVNPHQSAALQKLFTEQTLPTTFFISLTIADVIDLIIQLYKFIFPDCAKDVIYHLVQLKHPCTFTKYSLDTILSHPGRTKPLQLFLKTFIDNLFSSEIDINPTIDYQSFNGTIHDTLLKIAEYSMHKKCKNAELFVDICIHLLKECTQHVHDSTHSILMPIVRLLDLHLFKQHRNEDRDSIVIIGVGNALLPSIQTMMFEIFLLFFNKFNKTTFDEKALCIHVLFKYLFSTPIKESNKYFNTYAINLLYPIAVNGKLINPIHYEWFIVSFKYTNDILIKPTIMWNDYFQQWSTLVMKDRQCVHTTFAFLRYFKRVYDSTGDGYKDIVNVLQFVVKQNHVIYYNSVDFRDTLFSLIIETTKTGKEWHIDDLLPIYKEWKNKTISIYANKNNSCDTISQLNNLVTHGIIHICTVHQLNNLLTHGIERKLFENKIVLFVYILKNINPFSLNYRNTKQFIYLLDQFIFKYNFKFMSLFLFQFALDLANVYPIFDVYTVNFLVERSRSQDCYHWRYLLDIFVDELKENKKLKINKESLRINDTLINVMKVYGDYNIHDLHRVMKVYDYLLHQSLLSFQDIEYIENAVLMYYDNSQLNISIPKLEEIDTDSDLESYIQKLMMKTWRSLKKMWISNNNVLHQDQFSSNFLYTASKIVIRAFTTINVSEKSMKEADKIFSFVMKQEIIHNETYLEDVHHYLMIEGWNNLCSKQEIDLSNFDSTPDVIWQHYKQYLSQNNVCNDDLLIDKMMKFKMWMMSFIC